MSGKSAILAWSLWVMVSVGLGGYLASSLLGRDRTLFLMGSMTDGHHQIEQSCDVCHKEPFGGRQTLEQSCIECHGAELKAVQDTHPRTKFTDPRNADRVKALDARSCLACHREHRPGMTGAMGVTLPADYCFLCHRDIVRERPSHQNVPFDSCGTAGCHNFHDNKALYEDFLVEHLREPELASFPTVPVRHTGMAAALPGRAKAPLAAADQDAPAHLPIQAALLQEWETTAHAHAGVNCSDCHNAKDPVTQVSRWVDRPGRTTCQSCHQGPANGFLASRHGMRLAQGLAPMTPAAARQPMKPQAHGRELGCTSCHSAHAFDTAKAAVEACIGCHDDQHSRSYANSPHARLWQAERAGQAAPGSGVSCATCHMPREQVQGDKGERIAVQHNQNLNLRPNEKMIRGVCLDCHGLGFALDALADPALVARNFSGRPARHVESLEWAERRRRAASQPNEQSTPGRTDNERTDNEE